MCRPDDIRLSTALAGGALLDVGCYTVDAARRLVGERPETVVAVARYEGDTKAHEPADRYGVDLETAGLLRFPSGAIATVRCALTLPRSETLDIRGDAGSLRLDRAFLPGAGPTELRFEDASGQASSETVPGKDPYLAMVEAFADRVRGEKRPELPASDAAEAAATVRILERMTASARTRDASGGRSAATIQDSAAQGSRYAALAAPYASQCAISGASCSSTRPRSTIPASQFEVVRRHTSWRVGMLANARVSSLNPARL